MNIIKAEILISAVAPAQFPKDNRMEVAFAGKSNVGKSSLINAMLGRKRLAHTSRQPGKTRTINFYNVEDRIYFVDLPGYGFAKVSKAESAKWGGMIEGYLKNRPVLKMAFLLVDIRHKPGDNDKMLYDWFVHYDIPVTIVATKSDKISRSAIAKHIMIIKTGLETDLTPIPFSSNKKAGVNEVWDIIMDKCGFNMI